MVLNDWISHYEDGAYFNWAIELRETGSVIGNIAVVQLREDIEQVEIGYCMSRAFWGQGIMPEAFRTVMEYLFTVVGINRISAHHDVNNPKSGRVMAKAGLKKEGVHIGAGRNNQGLLIYVPMGWYAANTLRRNVMSLFLSPFALPGRRISQPSTCCAVRSMTCT